MRRRTIRVVILGIAAAASALTAAAATISSPYRPTSSPVSATRLAAPGQEGLDLDRAALDALRASGGEVRISGFPIGDGSLRTLALKRFEVTTPDALLTVSGPDGEKSLPFPSIAHFSGTIDGEPGASVYLSAQSDALYAYVRRAGGVTAYVGPAGTGSADFVARSGEEALAQLEGVDADPWSCAADELPAALTQMAEPSFPFLAADAPLAGLKQCGGPRRHRLRDVPQARQRGRRRGVGRDAVRRHQRRLRTGPRPPPRGRRCVPGSSTGPGATRGTRSPAPSAGR